jgi:hypothetical protein
MNTCTAIATNDMNALHITGSFRYIGTVAMAQNTPIMEKPWLHHLVCDIDHRNVGQIAIPMPRVPMIELWIRR